MKRKLEPTTSEKANELDKQSIRLEKFKFSLFYSTTEDSYICNAYKNRVSSPSLKGSMLIAEYYTNKYGCNIEFCHTQSSFQIDLAKSINTFKGTTELSDKENYRKAFLWGMDCSHAIPSIYIKEGNTEVIFIANSLASKISSTQSADYINNHTGIDVYFMDRTRQADTYSCFTDALVFARDCTAFSSKHRDYYIQDLLKVLKGQSLKKEKCYLVTKLPDELLKTCQITSFLNQYSDKDRKNIIHKNETLTEFRNRYTDKDTDVRVDSESEITKTDIYNYPRKKGAKFSEIIPIQFYLNQLNLALGNTLSIDKKLDFINQAKNIYRTVFDSSRKEAQLCQLILKFKFMEESEKPAPNLIQFG
ncbi:MAG: hypothetical protein H0U57_01585 [Tatlockia sp.]|nr:hypothetical protein [Tatlockia sp.]